MSEKRDFADADPDYEGYEEEGGGINQDLQRKRQEVIEKDGKEVTVHKIWDIVHDQFDAEITSKKAEAQEADLLLRESRQILDRLRACIVASYYSQAGLSTSINQKNTLAESTPSIHPTVKKFLGKKLPESISNLCSSTREIEQGTSNIAADAAGNQHSEGSYSENDKQTTGLKTVAGSQASTSRTAWCKIKKRIIVGNVSRYIPIEKRDENDQATHKWMMYVRGPKEEPGIDSFVEKVWFFLHPSYRPNDLVEISEAPFHLTRRGWGEFPVRVQLHFRDRRNKRVDVIHHLKLDRTYTGLQTLGAETVLDVELEKENATKPVPTASSSSASHLNSSNSILQKALNKSIAENDRVQTSGNLEDGITIAHNISPERNVPKLLQEQQQKDNLPNLNSSLITDSSVEHCEKFQKPVSVTSTHSIKQENSSLFSFDHTQLSQGEVNLITNTPDKAESLSSGFQDFSSCHSTPDSFSSVRGGRLSMDSLPSTPDSLNSSCMSGFFKTSAAGSIGVKLVSETCITNTGSVAKDGNNAASAKSKSLTSSSGENREKAKLKTNISNTSLESNTPINKISTLKDTNTPQISKLEESNVKKSKLDHEVVKSILSSEIKSSVSESQAKISTSSVSKQPTAKYIKLLDNKGRTILVPEHMFSQLKMTTVVSPQHKQDIVSLVPSAPEKVGIGFTSTVAKHAQQLTQSSLSIPGNSKIPNFVISTASKPLPSPVNVVNSTITTSNPSKTALHTTVGRLPSQKSPLTMSGISNSSQVMSSSSIHNIVTKSQHNTVISPSMGGNTIFLTQGGVGGLKSISSSAISPQQANIRVKRNASGHPVIQGVMPSLVQTVPQSVIGAKSRAGSIQVQLVSQDKITGLSIIPPSSTFNSQRELKIMSPPLTNSGLGILSPPLPVQQAQLISPQRITASQVAAAAINSSVSGLISHKAAAKFSPGTPQLVIRTPSGELKLVSNVLPDNSTLVKQASAKTAANAASVSSQSTVKSPAVNSGSGGGGVDVKLCLLEKLTNKQPKGQQGQVNVSLGAPNTIAGKSAATAAGKGNSPTVRQLLEAQRSTPVLTPRGMGLANTALSSGVSLLRPLRPTQLNSQPLILGIQSGNTLLQQQMKPLKPTNSLLQQHLAKASPAANNPALNQKLQALPLLSPVKLDRQSNIIVQTTDQLILNKPVTSQSNTSLVIRNQVGVNSSGKSVSSGLVNLAQQQQQQQQQQIGFQPHKVKSLLKLGDNTSLSSSLPSTSQSQELAAEDLYMSSARLRSSMDLQPPPLKRKKQIVLMRDPNKVDAVPRNAKNTCVGAKSGSGKTSIGGNRIASSLVVGEQSRDTANAIAEHTTQAHSNSDCGGLVLMEHSQIPTENLLFSLTPSYPKPEPSPAPERENIFSKYPSWKEMYRKHLEMNAAKIADVPNYRVADFPCFEDIMRCMVKHFPLIAEAPDRAVHPYCTDSIDAYTQWNVGKRRAAEFTRVVFLRWKLIELLGGTDYYKDEPIWSKKKMMLWCRQHGYTPLDNEVKIKQECSSEKDGGTSAPQHINCTYNSHTDYSSAIELLSSHVNSHRDETDDKSRVRKDCRVFWDEEEVMEVDVVEDESDDSPVRPHFQSPVKTCGAVLEDIILPPGVGAHFVQNICSAIGIGFKPCVIGEEAGATVRAHLVQDVLFQASFRLADDLLREAFSITLDKNKQPEQITSHDIYEALNRLPYCDFLTNKKLGLKVDEKPP